ncbi:MULTISPECIES: tRNA (adenosine(37)-N6)-threonylcarbamoyltransferase complex dimerization subunit type 1 TsaB [Shewanella]|jgi:tRNA threonylcarbamoyladenosine biosynthesis protein TsaB|uniref:tRNA (adenosine(37)-N6)-threonylcarbamoyltransferase complex dimerization subunit type 1 TsaB n=1 Tax=Shewanella TaxID=22 RepID=UPI0016760E50|nr:MULTISPECIES: tRNA (adenosine(37)-N6)-threonylcarbamoyltransferase complex dimerization subunit type 1 TsaB [Shewanella]MBO1271348.1 tRNA (adenosine(37)-N6)-threonylcarbamoyltransferase complex dimerization subunit type 1 TsaB [Shewanella sp. 4t3-1-2LB]MCL2905408.1 tRNA (adenosine(37)-N6)-threonylcarbamoyltransferase complex dimerization subunit type 1 TsaB [Shewanella fodinae]GGY90825.1 tRNA (adenosine(37)-N6)-threonylcarbamoyltransferase complex dimerization subunit type 1 TsaB [Shewanella 
MKPNQKLPPVVLALDTCTELCSAALQWPNGRLSVAEEAPREHSQRLLPMIDGLLSQAGLTMADVGLIAYGRGPGSFTGIRICTSMTQGLALARDIPVVGISTLAALAQKVIDSTSARYIISAIDARMDEIYWGCFEAVDGLAVLVGEEQVSTPQALQSPFADAETIFACGSGFETYPDLILNIDNLTLAESVKYPDADAMLTLAVSEWQQGHATTVDQLAPVYLRDTVAWKKLPGRA